MRSLYQRRVEVYIFGQLQASPGGLQVPAELREAQAGVGRAAVRALQPGNLPRPTSSRLGDLLVIQAGQDCRKVPLEKKAR